MAETATKDLESLERGRRLSESFDKYLLLLEEEFKHEDLAPRLRTLALNGLKISTGLSFEGWRERVAPWGQALDAALVSGSGEALDALLAKRGAWVALFERMYAYVNQAPIEARKLLDNERTDEDVRQVFEDQGRILLKDIVAWFKNHGAISAEPALAAPMAATPAAMKATIGAKAREASGERVLEVDHVVKRYGELLAVDGVSFSLRKGEVFGLLGPNGAGKTSLIECIEGIRAHDSGLIRLFGKDFATNESEIKQRVGIQLQTTGFFELLTAKEMLSLYASFYKRSVNIRELLEKLNLQDKANAPIKSLSGGMYQRLSLGLALVNKPELIFLDEPTTGLDPNARRDLWNLVREARDSGATIFLTTHYMEEAESLCSRVAIMDAGKIIAMGTPDELVREHVGQKTIEVDFEEQIELASVKSLRAVDKYWIRGTKLVLTSSDPQETMLSLFKLPERTLDIQMRRGNLEDVFLKLTNRGIE